jgi:hypothetical protein
MDSEAGSVEEDPASTSDIATGEETGGDEGANAGSPPVISLNSADEAAADGGPSAVGGPATASRPTRGSPARAALGSGGAEAAPGSGEAGAALGSGVAGGCQRQRRR